MKSLETKFEIGDLVCAIYEAEKGEVNRQEIVKIYICKNEGRHYITDAGYQYREEQLVSEIEALEIAIKYHKHQEKMLQEILEEKASTQILQTYE